MPRGAPDAMYGPGTVSETLISESVLLLGGPRALLLQLAEPRVARGVADHSNFRADPFGRLVRTLDAMTTIAFGSRKEAEVVLDRLGHVHDRVRGTLDDGTPYSAADPDLALWVHATLIDTVLRVERRYLGALSEAERSIFYEESKQLALVFGVPGRIVPEDLHAFEAYMAATVAALEVSDVARRLARAILAPRLPPPIGLLWEPVRLVTIDLLPAPIRAQYALPRDLVRRGILRTGQAASRVVLPRIPRPVRNLPTTARRMLAPTG